MKELPAKYDPRNVEEKWQRYWEENEIYKSEVSENQNFLLLYHRLM